MNTNKVIFALIICALIFGSCSNQEDVYDEPVYSSQRVKFNNLESFYTTMTKLSKMDNRELSDWIIKNNPSLSSNGGNNPNIDDDRIYFKALFGTNNEFQVGDSIIWYYNGKLLLVSASGNEKEASINKLNPLKCEIWGEVEKEQITIDETDLVLKGTMKPNAKSGSIQVNFDRPNNTRYKYKYVYQLYSYRTSVAANTQTMYELVFVNKLEYKYNSWGASDIPRICTLNLKGNVTAEVEGKGVTLNSYYSPQYNGTDELVKDRGFVLARTVHANGWHHFGRWSFNLSFSLTQQIKGEPETQRSSSFTF